MLVFVFDMCGNLLFSIQQISSNSTQFESTQFDRSIDVVVISSFPTTQSTELYNSVSPRPKRKKLYVRWAVRKADWEEAGTFQRYGGKGLFYLQRRFVFALVSVFKGSFGSFGHLCIV